MEEKGIYLIIVLFIICVIVGLFQPYLAVILGLLSFIGISIECGFKFPFWVYLLIGIIIVFVFLWGYVNVLLAILFWIVVCIVGVYYMFTSKKEEPREIEGFEPFEPGRQVPPLSESEKHILYGKAGHICENPNCRSPYLLEVHHIQPRAQGGQINTII